MTHARMMSATRWIGGLLAMVIIWIAVGLSLAELGVDRFLAGLIGILVAVSIVEPRSYLRRGLRRLRARKLAASA